MDGESVYDEYIWMNEYDGMINKAYGESNRKKKEVIWSKIANKWWESYFCCEWVSNDVYALLCESETESGSDDTNTAFLVGDEERMKQILCDNQR